MPEMARAAPAMSGEAAICSKLKLPASRLLSAWLSEFGEPPEPIHCWPTSVPQLGQATARRTARTNRRSSPDSRFMLEEAMPPLRSNRCNRSLTTLALTRLASALDPDRSYSVAASASRPLFSMYSAFRCMSPGCTPLITRSACSMRPVLRSVVAARVRSSRPRAATSPRNPHSSSQPSTSPANCSASPASPAQRSMDSRRACDTGGSASLSQSPPFPSARVTFSSPRGDLLRSCVHSSSRRNASTDFSTPRRAAEYSD